MIRKIEKDDKELFLRLTRAFYASPAVLHSVPDSYHTAVFEEMMRSDVYAEGYFLLADDGTVSGYALLAKTYSHEAGGLVVWIEEIYTAPKRAEKGLAGSSLPFWNSGMAVWPAGCAWKRSRKIRERKRFTGVSGLRRLVIGHFTKN